MVTTKSKTLESHKQQKAILGLKEEIMREIDRTIKVCLETNDESEKEFYRGLILAYVENLREILD